MQDREDLEFQLLEAQARADMEDELNDAKRKGVGGWFTAEEIWEQLKNGKIDADDPKIAKRRNRR